MTAFAISLVSILGVIAAFHYLAVTPVIKEAFEASLSGMATVVDKKLTDRQKETAVKSAGLALINATFQIVWRLIACFAVGAVPIVVFDLAGIVSTSATIELMLRWDYIIGTTLALCGAAWLVGRYRGRNRPRSAYSGIDQMTHRIAFAGPGIQLTAADLEDRLFAHSIRETRTEPPIFITSLPRAGTTILLEALNALPSVATHLYRDMPFVMAPVLWSRLSGRFRKGSQLNERAHGDGIYVGYDSPEAFEEVIWRAFWPEKFHGHAIDLWSRSDTKADASTFLDRHFRKIVLLRSNGNGRYVSKNNNNIARLDLLPHLFPGAEIIVPLREPAEHAASLLRQHENFLRQHAVDPFVERYMRDIGHLEFGNLHVPFSFPGFDASRHTPLEPSYWLEYWIAAYQMILERADELHFVTQERVCEQPKVVMGTLCERIGLISTGFDLTRLFHSIPRRVEGELFDARRIAVATDIYRALRHHEI